MRHFVEKREPQRRPVDLNSVAEEAVELVMLGLRGPGRMVRDLDRNLPAAIIDPVQIQQILVNLLRNAIEAVKDRPDPTVSIRTARRSDMLTVTVQDNGPGLKPEVLPTLFKAFSSSKRTGMGLGLSISRTIAQNHAGDLTVDPGGDGRGAAFTLHLPVIENVDTVESAAGGTGDEESSGRGQPGVTP